MEDWVDSLCACLCLKVIATRGGVVLQVIVGVTWDTETQSALLTFKLHKSH